MTPDELLALATKTHRAGDLPEAQRLYLQALAAAPSSVHALFNLGLLELQGGHPQAALAPIVLAIAAVPGEYRFQFGLGEVFSALLRWDEAAAAYRRVLQKDPRHDPAHFALGRALQSRGDLAGAIAAYNVVLELRPDSVDALNNLGNCHKLLGELTPAESAYRRALAINPRHASVMANFSTVLLATGRAAEAVQLLRAAADLEPAVATHFVNLGAALCDQCEFTAAAGVLRRARELDKSSAQAAFILGNALHAQGLAREAIEQYRAAMDLQPNYTAAMISLGNVLMELGDYSRAEAAYDDAARADPKSIAALNSSARLFRELGRPDEAESVLLRGLEIDPLNPVLHSNLGNIFKDTGRIDEAVDLYRRAVELDPGNASAHSNLVYSLYFQTADPRIILDESLAWNARHAAPLAPASPPRARDRSMSRRLRIGYVSPDFCDHCQALFTIPLLSHHDHKNFEIICYSSTVRSDDYTRRIAACADAWHEVRHLDDALLSDKIRADGVDILVDLTMHMSSGRPLVFARKPAPVQIAYLAYPGTTGMAARDFRLSDPRLDPPGYESYYTERTLRLPDAFWCYDPLTNQPEVSPLPALAGGRVTFGCLNNPSKLTSQTIALWSAVLRALPDAGLILLFPSERHRGHLLERFAGQGIDSNRVQFVPLRPRLEYLRGYQGIDICLDTFPYNGHTTSLDSFWMGVPVITRVGTTAIGRGTLSQLYQLNLMDLAAETDEAFTKAAVALAGDLPRLSELRQGLRARLVNSPLMDAPRFARNIEAIYRQAWESPD